MPYLSRRSVMLTGAAGVAAGAAALSVKAEASATFSPEYWECYRRRIEVERFRLSQAIRHFSDEEAAFEWETVDRYREAKDRLLERPVRNVFDVVALMRVGYWQDGHFIRVANWASARSDDVRAMKATEALVGGSWEVPEELIRLDAEMQALEEAKQASRSRRLRVNIDPDYIHKPGELDAWLQSEIDEMNEMHLDEILTPENVKI